MELVHFSELTGFAVRDKIERGRLYHRCHLQAPSTWSLTEREDEDYSIPGYQGLILTTSGLVNLNHRVFLDVGTVTDDPYWDKSSWGFYSKSQWTATRPHWNYAGDCGMWEVPDTYHNRTNFLLDRNALLRAGIRVVG